MIKKIRHFQTPEELVESARKNAEYWVAKKICFSFGYLGDCFIVCPSDEEGTQTANGSQMFFETLDESNKFFENFKMVIAHTPGRVRGYRLGGYMQKTTFVPKKEEPAMELQGMNGTIMEVGKE